MAHGLTSFRPEFLDQARKLAALGATDREVADFFEVAERTVHRWKQSVDGFAHALRVGKEAADDRVEQSLYRRATGYSYDAQKIFQHNGTPVVVDYVEHVPPCTTAAIFWLKNRRKDDWRDKTVVEHEGDRDRLAVLEAARQRVHGPPPLSAALLRTTQED